MDGHLQTTPNDQSEWGDSRLRLINAGCSERVRAHVSEASKTNIVSDFFIVRKYRKKGYGKRAAFHIFDQFPGAWEIRQTLANKPANQFWNRVIDSYTEGMYKEMILNEERWTGPIQVFGDEHNNTMKSDSIQLL
ncbi:hypothetical protein [Paenibacillus illinoisensis]|uniref:hypothetical protein n=1 Tax=Paenibacillus illinoisensis TaxID=59845 RepID=UPI003017B09B